MIAIHDDSITNKLKPSFEVKICTKVPGRYYLKPDFRAIVANAITTHNKQAMELSGHETRVVHGGVAERRRTTRFPVNEELKYRVMHKSSRISGTGKTLNFGSGGVLFTTEEKLPLGRPVELSVNWPARLGGTCPLKFVATGKVVRSETARAAIRIERYEFRTRASSDGLKSMSAVV